MKRTRACRIFIVAVCLSSVLEAGVSRQNWVRCGINHEPISPLMKAAKEGNVAALKKMTLSKSDLAEHANSQMTALHYAIKYGRQDAALFLINAGAPFNVLDMWDNSPLSLARDGRQKRVIDALENKFLNGAHFGGGLHSNDKHFVLLVASYNNAAWYTKNLDEIFKQDYKKFTVIYMDDLSTDGTYRLVLDYLNKRNLRDRVILIKNKTKRYCLGNYLFAVKRFCPDKAVLVTYDGDDWFNRADVLSYLNKVYQDPAVWLTYGNSLMYGEDQVTKTITTKVTPFCVPIEPHLLVTRSFRQKCKRNIEWPVHHLRSFYAALFRKINVGDFLDERKRIFQYAEDVAFMLPMIEMSGPQHHRYVADPLYVYNMKNPLLTAKRFGNRAIHDKLKFICGKKPYERIRFLF